MSLFRKKSIKDILHAAEQESHHSSIAKHLGVRDLT
ncbi:MAG: hypothetical protein JWO32_2453, partial [Bacteroidetes bacterium]|nr:hypothetical protein [Bacteroidota bacterium]